MKRKNAFTLIELLVVISIIALLMAIMMPALGKARKYARAVTCQTNLKQIGLAFEIYLTSNNNRLPVGYAVSNNVSWYGSVENAMAGTDVWDEDGNHIFMCPSEKKPSDMIEYRPISYKVNYGYFSYFEMGKELKYYNYLTIQSPDRKLAVLEGSWQSVVVYMLPQWATRSPYDLGGGGIAERHSDCANYLWMDWHITKEKEIPEATKENWGHLFPWIH